MTIDREKANLGAQTIKAFLDQFGSPSDPMTGLFLEVLLKELFDAKVVSVLGKSQQKGNQTNHDTQGGLDRNLSSNGSKPPGIAPNLADADRQDH